MPRRLLASLLGIALVASSSVAAQEARPTEPTTPPRAEEPAAPEATPGARIVPPGQIAPEPFGSTLFTGTYAAHRPDGLTPDYLVLPGDRVMVSAWGAVTVNEILTVDAQGNVFLPTVGPIHVAGVRNDELTPTVRTAMQRLYRGAFDVYTNLLSASPVAVFVTGGVRRPGRYAGIPSDSVLVFLDQAGGIEPESGSYRRISVLRQGQVIAELDLYEFILHGQLPALQFEEGDVVLVGRRGPVVEVHPNARVPVLVELARPADGASAAHDGTGADILAITMPGAHVNAVTVRGSRAGSPTVRTLDLAEFAAMRLIDGDVVTFRADLTADRIVVRLEGEFLGHSELAVPRGTRMLDLLNYVRVDPELSNVDAVHLRRRAVQAQQRQSLQESLDRLEHSVLLAQSDTQGEATIRRQEAEMVRAFVQQARHVEPLGIVVTSTAGRQVNLLLEEGDVIVIPRETNVVRIVGEVMVPQAVMFRPDISVDQYVRAAGGYTDRANSGHILIRRANAEIVVGASAELRVEPGDEVIIPPRVDDKWIQNGIDLAEVVYHLAVAASVVIRTGL